MNSNCDQSKIQKINSWLTQPLSEKVHVLLHVVCLLWLQVLNIYADSIDTRDDVRPVLTGMMIIGATILIRNLWRIVHDQLKMSFLDVMFPVAIFITSGLFVANCGADIIDIIVENPKFTVLYMAGFVIGALFMRFNGRFASQQSCSIYHHNVGSLNGDGMEFKSSNGSACKSSVKSEDNIN